MDSSSLLVFIVLVLVLVIAWKLKVRMARADRAVSPDMVFVPFAYVEAAANILTNPAVDPYGKIPEFKFAAVKVEKAGDQIAAE